MQVGTRGLAGERLELRKHREYVKGGKAILCDIITIVSLDPSTEVGGCKDTGTVLRGPREFALSLDA